MLMRNITSWGEKTGKYSSVACRASGLKQASSFELFDVDFRLLASCSRLLAVACWLPPLACPLSYAGCRLLASIFHLLASTCWLPSPAYWLLPVGFHIYLACLFSLSPAGCLSPAGIRLPPVDLRLLASCSRLLAVACWVPPPAGSLSHAGCRLLAASIFHLLAFTFCFLFLAAPLRVHPHMTLAAESWRPWLIDPQRGLWSLSGARAVGLREA